MKPKGHCTTVVSAAFLAGVEKKTWQISTFHNQRAIDDRLGFQRSLHSTPLVSVVAFEIPSTVRVPLYFFLNRSS